MKKALITIIVILFSVVKGTSQIKSLNDLFKISQLSIEEMKSDLSETWKLKLPIRTDSEEGSETKHYVFKNYSENKKQVIRKSGRFQYNKNKTYWLTDFQCNDIELLKKIKSEIITDGFTIEVDEKNRIVYDNGSKSIIIRTKYSGKTSPNSFIYKDYTEIEFYEIRIVN